MRLALGARERTAGGAVVGAEVALFSHLPLQREETPGCASPVGEPAEQRGECKEAPSTGPGFVIRTLSGVWFSPPPSFL